MTTDPYDQATDQAFDQITSPYRHPGGRTMTRDTKTKTPATAEDKRAQAWQMLGCGGMVLCIALAVAVVTLAWRL